MCAASTNEGSWVEMSDEEISTYMKEVCHDVALLIDRMTPKQRAALERKVEDVEAYLARWNGGEIR